MNNPYRPTDPMETRPTPPTTGRAVNHRVSSLDNLVREITSRGNDVEVRTCREGIKVFEISKRVAGVFPSGK